MFQLKQYFQSWAARRSPKASQVVLRHRTIYVFPSKQGIAFLAVVLVIWVLGTNYQNNLILALSFFLISIMLISIIHAFKNLLGLTFTPSAIQYAEVGEAAPFDIILNSVYRSGHAGLLLSVDGADSVRVDVNAGQQSPCRLSVNAVRRGWLKLPRIVLRSYFPFGLIRAWTYIELDHRTLIFPRSIENDQPPLGVGQGDEGKQISRKAGDEFQGFQSYQPGSPLSHVAWKQFARGAGMHLKDYRALQSEHFWLDWHSVALNDTELALSHLSYWVNYFSQKNIEFGLIMPNATLELGAGDVHRIKALSMLALYGWEAE